MPWGRWASTIVALWLVAHVSGTAQQRMTNPLKSEPDVIRRGSLFYRARCAGCHGLDGSANTKAGKNTGAHDFRAPDTDTESDANLVQIVTKGKKKMPKFEEKLKPKEIKELVAYIRGFSRKGQ